MQRLLEMYVPVEQRGFFRRPGQKATENFNKIYPDPRKVASQGAYSRKQGRPVADVGVNRLYVSPSVRYHAKNTQTNTIYPIIGNNKVEIVRYTEPGQSTDKGIVWINQKQYFKNVPPEVWNFSLGNCQICQKWLKDREGRSLTNKDIQHYQRIVLALKEMIDLMAGIDAAIQHEKFNERKLSTAAHS